MRTEAKERITVFAVVVLIVAGWLWASFFSPYIPRNIRSDLEFLEERVEALEGRVRCLEPEGAK